MSEVAVERARARNRKNTLWIIGALGGGFAIFIQGLALYGSSSIDLLYQVACGNPSDDFFRCALLQEPRERNPLGQGAIHVAVAFDRLSVLPELAQAELDVNLQDTSGMTPLHVAALWHRTECAEWLLANGAEMDVRDVFGDTPLHTAAIFGAQGVYALLLEHGADAAAKNNDGRTPRDLAVHFGQGEMVTFIDGLKSTAGVSPASSGTRLKNAGGTPAVRIAAR